MRIAYLIAGILLIVLALIGAVLPLVPTTIFLILAAASFARSSPRLEAWLLSHRYFGPPIRRWRERGAISPGAKAMAVGGMAAGFAAFLYGAAPAWPLAAAVGAGLAACAAYVLSRPAR
jgi:uncharacterized protein